jgi:hypothetical protein
MLASSLPAWTGFGRSAFPKLTGAMGVMGADLIAAILAILTTYNSPKGL